MSYMEELGKRAKAAMFAFGVTGTEKKNEILETIAARLSENKAKILEANGIDVVNAKKDGMSESLLDRLTLTDARIDGIVSGVREVKALPDPIGEVIGGSTLSNGLSVVKKRVPLGVIGIICEARPNVTVDAAALCIKSGNVCILRGGSAAIESNKCLIGLIREVLNEVGSDENALSLVEETSRESATEMMRLSDYIDVLIPRGGKGLIQSVVKNSTVPVIETGAGNCHIYIDEFADIKMAVELTDNAKTQRPSVCNSIETVLVHKRVAEAFFTALKEKWNGRVKIYGDRETAKFIPVDHIATDEDYATEFNDYVIAAKVVGSVDEAIDHINKYGTRHSEAIVTINLDNAAKFQEMVDAAAVYVNASTRFTDGNVFGLGAEIGISNQKLHARGPMGLKELTSYKYLVNGHGEIRK